MVLWERGMCLWTLDEWVRFPPPLESRSIWKRILLKEDFASFSDIKVESSLVSLEKCVFELLEFSDTASLFVKQTVKRGKERVNINVMVVFVFPCCERTVKLPAMQTVAGLDGGPPRTIPVTAASRRRVCCTRTQRSSIVELREQGTQSDSLPAAEVPFSPPQ